MTGTLESARRALAEKWLREEDCSDDEIGQLAQAVIDLTEENRRLTDSYRESVSDHEEAKFSLSVAEAEVSRLRQRVETLTGALERTSASLAAVMPLLRTIEEHAPPGRDYNVIIARAAINLEQARAALGGEHDPA